MTEPTPRQRAALDQYFAEAGVSMTGDHYDRDRLLAANRESRHLHAKAIPEQHAAVNTLVDGIHSQMRADVPITDWAQAVDALLATSAYLSIFAADGADPVALVAAIAYLADDIATEEGL